MKTIAFIFARGGSKGLPGKNVKLLNDTPLIAYSINIAKAMKEIDEVIVSTDDEVIAKVAKEYGASVPFLRPESLAKDESDEFLAWKHAVGWVLENKGNFDVFISLPATSPLRNSDDVRKCLATLTDSVDMVLTCKDADRNPYFNMVKQGQEGFVELVNAEEKIFRRQDAPEVYDLTTVAYVCRPSFILQNNHVLDGKTKTVFIPKDRAVDIDDKWDFMFAELLMKEKNAK
jgi:N,N'-diacetyl-8-epilegionaminate cytidylyltransferase